MGYSCSASARPCPKSFGSVTSRHDRKGRLAVNAQPLLEVRNLRAYIGTPRGTVRAVDDVSLNLDSGQALGIVGESGSGKSVMARASWV